MKNTTFENEEMVVQLLTLAKWCGANDTDNCDIILTTTNGKIKCHLQFEDVEEKLTSAELIEIIEFKALNYERGKMLRDDSKVEINFSDGSVYLCDYSASREGAETIEEICSADDIDRNELIKMCDKHGWSYVL